MNDQNQTTNNQNEDPAPAAQADEVNVTEPLSAEVSAPPVIARPDGRRRPRFIEQPKQEESSVINRRNLLVSTRRTDGKPQFSRERKIAGNLPSWDPTPPGEILVQR